MNIPATDNIVFSIIHVAFYSFVIFSFVKNIAWLRPGKITRGEESQKRYSLAYGFISVIVIQLIQVSTAFVGHKVLISVIDLSFLFYLVFYNGWFRNWFLCRIHEKSERPE